MADTWFTEQLLPALDDSVSFESMVDQLSNNFPAPRGDFFGGEGVSPVANNSMQQPEQGMDINKALGAAGKMFAGNTDPAPAAHYAPLPGAGRGGGGASIKPVGVSTQGNGAPAKVDPLQSLAELIMKGAG